MFLLPLRRRSVADVVVRLSLLCRLKFDLLNDRLLPLSLLFDRCCPAVRWNAACRRVPPLIPLLLDVPLPLVSRKLLLAISRCRRVPLDVLLWLLDPLPDLFAFSRAVRVESLVPLLLDTAARTPRLRCTCFTVPLLLPLREASLLPLSLCLRICRPFCQLVPLLLALVSVCARDVPALEPVRLELALCRPDCALLELELWLLEPLLLSFELFFARCVRENVLLDDPLALLVLLPLWLLAPLLLESIYLFA